MIKKKGMPITGAKPAYSKKAPLVPDAKDTSANAQTMIAEAPMPFKNRMTSPNLPVKQSPSGAKPGLEESGIYAGKSGQTVGARALPSRGPIGQRKPINNSGNVFGKFGTTHPKKHRPNGAGYPSKKGAAFYGEV